MFGRSGSTAAVFAAVGSLLCSPQAGADSYVAGANYSNGQVYALCFDDESGTAVRSQLSADGGTKPVSLVFFTGKTDELGKEELQLLVADEAGEIRRFGWGETLTIGEEPQKDCNNVQISPRPSLYSKQQGPGPAAPNGLSVAPGDLLLVLNNPQGSGKGKGKKSGTPGGELWKFDLLNPASQPVKVLSALPHGRLEETLVLPSNLSAQALHDDLLIVANDPSVVKKVDRACYEHPTSGCGGAAVVDFIGGDSAAILTGEPAGITLLPSPNQDKLLLSSNDGSVALYDISSGQAVLEDETLISNLGAGKFKIKALRDLDSLSLNGRRVVSFQANLYVAGRNNGSVQQISLSLVNGNLVADTASILQVSDGIQHARALATTSEDFIRIAPCEVNCPDKLVVDIAYVIEHEFDTSAQTGEPVAGYIGETYQVLRDPRPACNSDFSTLQPGPLFIWKSQVYPYDPDPVTPLDPDSTSVMIPGYLCGSPAHDPHILLVRTLSDIETRRSEIGHRTYDTDFDGDGLADLSCLSADRGQQPVVGWAPIPETGEDSIVEGQQIIDTVTGCGSVRIKTRELSYFVIGLRNHIVQGGTALTHKTRQNNLQAAAVSSETYQYSQRVNAEFKGLRDTLSEAVAELTCVANPLVAAQVDSDVADIQSDLLQQDYSLLESKTLNLLNQIRDNDNHLAVAAKGSGCSKNYLGDLNARATHVYFSLATKLLGKVWVPGCPESLPVEQCLQ
ncbi:hypothetical protein [Bowmanella dokdonensis]|uniref:Uncharacterized protein n=1 Tax=Bowmanella dokdonensis TaxID=751969 RepID=A0A939DNF1_9ALTE|nr:hypothetical protein [Bowmanella dokdonensis]MBN7825800.1 hypothetical protein [Bowmanella dokdonensis]